MLLGSWAAPLRAEGTSPPPRSSLDQAVDQIKGSENASGASTENDHDHGHSHGHKPIHAAATGEEEAGMIAAFFASWGLFHDSYLVGWLAGLVLALVGVVVVARDQVFLGAAVSQASTLGIALALAASSVYPLHQEGSSIAHGTSWLCCDSTQVAMAVVFSVLAALVTSLADRAKRESHEAITGWVFLVSAALAVLVVAHSPHGLEEVYRLHSSSILGATAADVVLFALLLIATSGMILLAGDRLLLWVMDAPMAASVGMKVRRWAVFESLWLGLVVGLSIRVSGMLFTFGGLVLPALAAKNVCREVRPMFLVAPAVSLAANTLGFVIANRYDFPPAQMNVAILGAFLLVIWGLRALRAR